MLLNEDIVDIEKSDGIGWLTFVVDEFSGLFLHASIFSIIYSKSVKTSKTMKGVFYFI